MFIDLCLHAVHNLITMFRIMAVVRGLLSFKLVLLRGCMSSQFRAQFLRGLGLSGVSEFSALGLSFSRPLGVPVPIAFQSQYGSHDS